MGKLLDAYHAGRETATKTLVVGEVFVGVSAAADAAGCKDSERRMFIVGYLERFHEMWPDGVNTRDGRIVAE